MNKYLLLFLSLSFCINANTHHSNPSSLLINQKLDTSNLDNPYQENFLFKNDNNNYVKYFDDNAFYRFSSIFTDNEHMIKYIISESFYKYTASECYKIASDLISRYSNSYNIEVDRSTYNSYSFSTSKDNLDINIKCSTGYNEDYSKFAITSIFYSKSLSKDKVDKIQDVFFTNKYDNKGAIFIDEVAGIKVGELLSNYNYIDTFKLSLERNISKLEYFHGDYILNTRSRDYLNFDEVSVDENGKIKEIFLSHGTSNQPIFDLSQKECFSLLVEDLDRIKFSKTYFSYYEADSQRYEIGKLYGLVYKINISYNGKYQNFKIYCHSPLNNGKYTYQKALFQY